MKLSKQINSNKREKSKEINHLFLQKSKEIYLYILSATFSLTSAQANHVTRSERHSLCACLTFSTDICAADPRSTAYIQYSLRTSLRNSG